MDAIAVCDYDELPEQIAYNHWHGLWPSMDGAMNVLDC